LDTKIKDKNKLVNRVKKQIKPGAIILFHDTIDGIEIALEEVLLYLKENNYEVVSLNQLLNIKAYA
jgi:peptidoglycan/xylan/chitin deacetylase (PgdA/CDA1 family)